MTQAELKEQLKDAMRAKDATRLSVIRGLMSAITNECVAKGYGPDGTLSDDEMLTVITRAAKQRKDSIEQFEQGGRPELAESEKAELAILQTMLPAQMSRDEIVAAAQAKAAELGIDPSTSVGADKTGVNQLMGSLMKDLKGKADGTLVKEIVDSMFA
ncbi:MAG TPA: GatB/YqeY domain-containing protein [Candidatus Paceibacterota bacterium]|nr:GatB/YqeY domain-containing protein [Candidatus Paceibacterota bacterium]